MSSTAKKFCSNALVSIWRNVHFFLFFFFILSLLVISTAWFVQINKSELIPGFCVSVIALGLTYWACIYSKEKFRLDLLDKRFEIYTKTLEFCSRVAAGGTLQVRLNNQKNIERAIKAAHESFRGIGYHKTRALFGNEIWDLFDKLNDSYAALIAYGDGSSNDEEGQKFAKLTSDALLDIISISNDLPNHFKSYVYFGNYKK